MNRPDDDFADLHDELRSALGAEPPMSSLPEDDLARGRRLARRHRWTAVGAAATVVPAMALGGYAVSAYLDTATGPGARSVELRPAGAPETGADDNPDDPNDSSGTLTSDCEVSPMPDPGGSGSRLRAVPQAGGGQGTGVTSSEGSVEPLSGDCIAVNGDPIETAGIDRVTAALNRHVDPDGSHAGTSIADGSVSDGDTTSGIYVGQEWVDGETAGTVTLSVEDGSQGGSDSCLDRSIVGGPHLTCETRTLDDGTTVVVGRGEQDGAERISVQYVRPDGTVIWATADEASEQWWEDQRGAAPLTLPPATVDQLIDLVRDSDVHL